MRKDYQTVILKELKKNLLEKKLRPGEKLPSTRQLSLKYSVSHITILKVYNILEKNGIIEKIKGKGCFIKKNNFYKLSEDSFTEKFFSLNNKTSSNLPIILKAKTYISEKLEKKNIFVKNKNILFSNSFNSFFTLLLNLINNKKLNIAIFKPICTENFYFLKNLSNLYCIDNLQTLKTLLEKVPIDFLYLDNIYLNINPYNLIKIANEYNFYIIEYDFLSDSFPCTLLKTFDKIDSERIFYIRDFSKIFKYNIQFSYILIPSLFEKELNFLSNLFFTLPSELSIKFFLKNSKKKRRGCCK